MRVAWLQDHCPAEHVGMGAESNDWAVIKYGLRAGLDLRIFTPGTIQFLDQFTPELLIISNTVNFPREMIQKLCGKTPYIFFLHDYYPLCNHRLFYPQAKRCRSCSNKEFWVPILQKAELLVWLSPLHRDAWLYACPELEKMACSLVPSAISVDEFINLKNKRPGDILTVNTLYEFKGRENMINYARDNPDRKLTVVGDGDASDLPDNCSYIGRVGLKELKGLYNTHNYLLELPLTSSPFDRTVMEAWLSGCKLIVNDLIGCLSWGWGGRVKARNSIRRAPRKFWSAIDEVIR